MRSRVATASLAAGLLAGGVGLYTGPAAAASTPPSVSHSQTTTATPTTPSYYTAIEGGATDGTYWYTVAVHHTKDAKGDQHDSDVQVLKTKLGTSMPTLTATYKVTKSGASLLGHGNDMTYNPDTKQLLVAASSGDAPKQGKTVEVLDPATLKSEGTRTLAHEGSTICYDSVDKRYLAGSFGQYSTYDSAFKETGHSPDLRSTQANGQPADSTHPSPLRGKAQGIDCDKSYVYVVTSSSDGSRYPSQSGNVVYVYDWSFHLVTEYSDSSNAELETAMHFNNTSYLELNTTSGPAGVLYRVDDFQFTVHYAANGGTGTMADTIVLYNQPTALRTNAFVRAGYTFTGWSVERSYDGKTRYTNPKDAADTGWYVAGKQPKGWTLILYADQNHVQATSPRGTVTMTANWKNA